MIPSVFYLEDSLDLRELMSALLKVKLNAESICLGSVSEMMLESVKVLQTKIAILDINLGNGCPSGIDAYDWLKSQNYSGKIYFLTGHAHSHPLVAKACESGAEVLDKPIVTEKVFPNMKTYLREIEL